MTSGSPIHTGVTLGSAIHTGHDLSVTCTYIQGVNPVSPTTDICDLNRSDLLFLDVK